LLRNGAGYGMLIAKSSSCHGKFYCGRRLGSEAIPGSDGRCGVSNGPQCQACAATDLLNGDGVKMRPGRGSGANILYCGRTLGTTVIPHSDGQCGPDNGPQVSFAKLEHTSRKTPKFHFFLSFSF
jgi:hypothetical protein